MLRAAERFGVLGVERVIFTKLDEAISCGIVFSVLKKVGASLSYITTGQAVPDDIEVGNSRMLAQKLVMCQN
jgi:flagellar biosynthesis protein FlhF